MTRRPVISLLGLALAAFIAFNATPARAGANDAQAKQLAEEALFEDYLNLNFDDARTKLILAVNLCLDECSPDVKGSVLRDLGVVYVAGLKQRDEGISTFIKALAAYPDLELDPDLANAEITEAFEEAKTLAASGQDAPPPVEEEKAEEGAGVVHKGITSATVNTPLPIFVILDEDELEAEIKKVKVFFRGFGMARFKEEPMGELDDGVWGIELGCKSVGRSKGKFEYYIVIIDDEEFEVTTVGSDSDPQIVKIVDEANPAPAPLPGTSAPVQCASQTVDGSLQADIDMDCPPDFPGCGPGGDDDEWEDEESDYAQHWFSVSFQQDFLLMAATKDACSVERPTTYNCYYGNGAFRDALEFEDIAATIDGIGSSLPTDLGMPPVSHPDAVSDRAKVGGITADSGTVAGGLAAGSSRVLLGYEFAVTPSLLVGGKIGFAFGGGPTLDHYRQYSTGEPRTDPPVVVGAVAAQQHDTGPAFMPIHAEVRLSYFFLTEGFFRPYAGVSGGLAQMDASVPTQVSDKRYLTQDCATTAGFCISDVDVWQKSGTAFVSGGLGALMALGDNHGVMLEGRFLQLFPATGSAVGAQAGYMVGF